MEIKYEKGENFNESFFVISHNDKSFKVSAAELLPESVQDEILKGNESIVSPEEIGTQLVDLSDGDYNKLVNDVIPELKQNANKKNKEIKEASLNKKSEFAWAEDEIVSQKKVKQDEGPVVSVKEEEIKKTEEGSPIPSKVKNYFSKLPGKTVDAPEQAINIQSSLKEENEVIKKKIELLKEAIMKEKENRIKAEQELKVEKEKNEKRDKTEMIENVIEEISEIERISENQKEKIIELLNKFSPIQLNFIRQLFEVIKSESSEKEVDLIGEKSLDKKLEFPKLDNEKIEKPKTQKEASMPQIFLNPDENDIDIIEIAQKSLDK